MATSLVETALVGIALLGTALVGTALVGEYLYITSYFIERIHAFKSIKPIRGMRSLDCASISAAHNLQDLKKFRLMEN